MTSRVNQSVSPPASIQQQRHVNVLASSPPPSYFSVPSPGLQQAYEYLQPHTQSQAYYQGYDFRGQPGSNGRGQIQQSLPPQQMGFNPQPAHGYNMRPQPMQPVPQAANYYIQPGPSALGPPRQQQPNQQFFYLQPGGGYYTMQTAAPMYASPTQVPVYQQNSYIQTPPSYPPAGMVMFNGNQWATQSVANTSSVPYQRAKKVLSITDPNTGRNITEEILNSSVNSSDVEDPYDQASAANNNSVEIRQTFSRLVAESLKSPDEAATSGGAQDAVSTPLGAHPGSNIPSQQYQPSLIQPGPHPQQQQMLQTSLKGPGSVIQTAQNGQSAIPAQVMPRPAMTQPQQQPPVSVTPPDRQHPLLVNLSMPPPQLQVRGSSSQPGYSPVSQQHPVLQHPQTPPQQQPSHQHPPTPPHQQIPSHQHPPTPPHQQIPSHQHPPTPPHQQIPSHQHPQTHSHPQQLATHPQQLATHPQQLATHPQQLASHPQQPASHPQQLASHPQQLASHPQQLTSHPQQLASHPQQLTSHPQQLTSHPQQLASHQQQLTSHQHPQTLPQQPVHQQQPTRSHQYQQEPAHPPMTPQQHQQSQPLHQQPPVHQPHPQQQQQPALQQPRTPPQQQQQPALQQPRTPPQQQQQPALQQPRTPPQQQQQHHQQSLSVAPQPQVQPASHQAGPTPPLVAASHPQQPLNPHIQVVSQTPSSAAPPASVPQLQNNNAAGVRLQQETEALPRNVSKVPQTSVVALSPSSSSSIAKTTTLAKGTGLDSETSVITQALPQVVASVDVEQSSAGIEENVTVPQGGKDIRKGKKKTHNDKNIVGSDMGAFNDSEYKTDSLAVGSSLFEARSTIQSTTDSLVNGESNKAELSGELTAQVPEPSQAAATDLSLVSANGRQLDIDKKTVTPQLSREASQDKDKVKHSSDTKNKDAPKQAITQVESKYKQKKKRKKPHHSPPNQKSKHSASSNAPEHHSSTPEPETTSVSPTCLVSEQSTIALDKASEQDLAKPPSPTLARQDSDTKSDMSVSESSQTAATPQRDGEGSPAVEESLAPTTTEPVILNSANVSPVSDTLKELAQVNSVSHDVSIATVEQHSSTNIESDAQQNIQSSEQQEVTPEPPKLERKVSDTEILALSERENKPQINGEVSQPEPEKSVPGQAKKDTKYRYDRAHLMKLRDCASSLAKPEGLPDLEIILELPVVSASRGSSTAPLDFTPSFFQQGTPLRGPIKRPDVQAPLIINLHSSAKPLHQSEKPWKPTMKQLSAGELAEKRKSLESAVLFIMNRLTPTNFERLAGEMAALNIKTYADLEELVRIFFDKVTIETKFVEAYAKLCLVLAPLKVPPPPNSDIKENQATFRVVMLTKCQQEFEADKTAIFEDPEEKKRKMEAEMPEGPERDALIENTLYQMKMRRLKFYGNIRFIGELFKLKLLTENIMHDCISRLLKARDDDSLLSLCNLISTVGQQLDAKSRQRMDQYFAQMAKIAEERKSRIKFTLKDVIDLRNNNWVPRKEQTGPKKIDEVHKDYQQEQATKQFMQTQPLPPRLEAVQQNARRGSKQRQEEKQVVDEGWNTVGSKSQRIDVSKMRLSKSVVDENSIQLGPGGGINKFSIWSRGSSAAAQQPAADERAPSNRFSALRSDEDRRSYPRSPTRGDVSNRGSGARPTVGHGRGRILSRSSQEGDSRQGSMTGTRTRTVGRSQTSSRENSWNREDRRQLPDSRGSRETENSLGSVSESRMQQPAVSQPVALGSDNQQVKKFKPLSVAEMEQKAKTILQEYLAVKDLEEAKLCVLELRGQEYMHEFVTTCFNEVLERSAKDRQFTGSFFHEIVKEGLLPLSIYIKGLSEVLSCAEDMVIDIPKLWTCLGQIIAPMLLGGSLSWSQLSSTLQSYLSQELWAVLLAEILLVMKEKCSEQEVAAIWQKSGLDWSDFLKPDERSSFLKRMQLEFTVGSSSSKPDWQRLADEIEALVHKHASRNDILSCILKYNKDDKISSKQLVRAIVTAILNAAISPSDRKFQEKVLKSYKDIFLHYVKGNPDLELEALYAVQALMHKLEHPQGVVSSIFDTLYEEEIISEDVFKKYEKNDGQELEGRGACLLQLVHFYSWLNENEELETS